jgi:hypothetical protein
MEYTDSLSDIEYQWYNSISQIGREAWENIFGSSVIKGYDFFLAAEESNFSGVSSFSYLSIYKCKKNVAIIACFSYNLDLMDLMKSGLLKSGVDLVRSNIPDFFKLKTVVIGSFPATCEHFTGISPELEIEHYSAIGTIIQQQLRDLSRKEAAMIMLIKDVRSKYLDILKPLFGKKWRFFSSFPTNVIPVSDLFPYPQALKKKNRKRVRLFIDKFDSSFTWEITNQYEQYIETFTRLYLNVLSKAKNRFETLNYDFFRKVYEKLSDKSFFLIARDRNSDIRLIEFVIEEEDRLIPLYLGIKYLNDDTRILYLNVIFKTIKEAERRGKKLVEFGQTSYYPKVMSGTFVEDIYYGFSSNKRYIQFLIEHLFEKIFTPTSIPNNVYHDTYHVKAVQLLKNKGFFPMND